MNPVAARPPVGGRPFTVLRRRRLRFRYLGSIVGYVWRSAEISGDELNPEEAGLDLAKLAELRACVRRDVDAGLLPAAQFALARHGRLVAFEAFGSADAPATVATRFTTFSCIKPVVASGLWPFLAAGELVPAQPVRRYVPTFTGNGKDEVTVEQLLLHTGGFPHAPLGALESFDRDSRRAAFTGWELAWAPGTRYEYHPLSAYWVVAELLEQLGGAPYADVLHETVTRPLGLSRLLGLPADEQADIADVTAVGEPPTPDELRAAMGLAADVELPVDELDPALVQLLNLPEVRSLGVPGGGGVATAADLVSFYQALLAPELWPSELVADMVGRVRNTFPNGPLGELTGLRTNRALCFEVAGSDGQAAARGFGHGTSAAAFGHAGLGGQVAWADPVSGLSFSFLTSGYDRDRLRELARSAELSTLAAACVAPTPSAE